MLDIDFAEMRSGFARYGVFGAVIAVMLAAEIIIAEGARSVGPIALAQRISPIVEGASNTTAIGMLLYTRYLYIFEAAGLVLLVALIGAVVLTHRERGGIRVQSVNDQVRRRPEDATRNVNQPVGVGVEL
jgi:NADH-quinone oxidoreductase subunit J